LSIYKFLLGTCEESIQESKRSGKGFVSFVKEIFILSSFKYVITSDIKPPFLFSSTYTIISNHTQIKFKVPILVFQCKNTNISKEKNSSVYIGI